MTERLLIAALLYGHLISLSLWFGGLFGYVLIVWPSIMREADGEFPRALLARIAMATAPWIYVAMVSALACFAAIWVIGGVPVAASWMTAYIIVLVALVANNVYGTVAAWPRIMLLPRKRAQQEWYWFRVRMGVSLVAGLGLYSLAILYVVTGR
jgi:hypothetical protein